MSSPATGWKLTCTWTNNATHCVVSVSQWDPEDFVAPPTQQEAPTTATVRPGTFTVEQASDLLFTEIVLGRNKSSKDSTWHVEGAPSNIMSGKHCLLRLHAEGKVEVSDCCSFHGTFIQSTNSSWIKVPSAPKFIPLLGKTSEHTVFRFTIGNPTPFVLPPAPPAAAMPAASNGSAHSANTDKPLSKNQRKRRNQKERKKVEAAARAAVPSSSSSSSSSSSPPANHAGGQLEGLIKHMLQAVKSGIYSKEEAHGMIEEERKKINFNWKSHKLEHKRQQQKSHQQHVKKSQKSSQERLRRSQSYRQHGGSRGRGRTYGKKLNGHRNRSNINASQKSEERRRAAFHRRGIDMANRGHGQRRGRGGGGRGRGGRRGRGGSNRN